MINVSIQMRTAQNENLLFTYCHWQTSFDLFLNIIDLQNQFDTALMSKNIKG